MLLATFQYNYVDFKFFPDRDAGAEVKVFVREFSVLGPDAPVTIAGGNSDATVAGSYEDHLIHDVLAVPGGDAGFLLFIPRPGTVPES